MKSEKFVVYLKSANALSGSSTPHQCVFNVGSVYDNAPALQRYADADYCYVKASNFTIKRTAAEFETLGTSNVLISVSAVLPNSLDNNATATGLGQSRIIATVPTGAASYTYSNQEYDNESVKCSNIFKGELQITLTKQDGSSLSALPSGANWYITLCVYFSDDPALNNY